MNLKELTKIAQQIAEEKKIDADRIFEVVESSLAAAYRKEYGTRGMAIKAKMDLKTGEVKFWQEKTVVDESMVRILEEAEMEEGEATSREDQKKDREGGRGAEIKRDGEEGEIRPRYNPDRHIFIEEAKEIKPDAKIGEEMIFSLPTPEAEFGRIAAQTAKQNILQKLREVERESIISEFAGREETAVSGIVRRFERGNVYVDLGRAEGIMFYNESIPGEHYRIGDRMKFYIINIQDDNRGAQIILSRSHPKFISRLFESEVPEMADETVEIKAIAREAGSRTKIAVASNDESVDAVGSFVGQRGTRVMAVNNEIGQEKLDIIKWSENQEEYVANSMSPAKVTRVEIGERREVRVFVLEDQLSLAIGRGGQNVRLAVKLTGFKIDVRSESRPEEAVEGGVVDIDEEGNIIQKKIKKEIEEEKKLESDLEETKIKEEKTERAGEEGGGN